MTNSDVARILRHVAAAYAVKDEKKHYFQIVAYKNAADAIESMTVQVQDLVKENRLQELPGIGNTLKSHLEELFATGHAKQFDLAMDGIPQSMFSLLDIPSFGPKKAFKLVTAFQLTDPDTVIETVEKLAKEHKIQDLESFGIKSEDLILQAIEEYHAGKSKDVRMPLPYATELAEKIIAYLKECPATKAAYPLGSLRRNRDTIGDVDIAVATDEEETVLKHFAAYPYTERLLQLGKNEANLLTAGGKRVDLRTMPPQNMGSLLQHFTGSKNHNVHLREFALKKGLSLSEYGIKVKNDGDKLLTFDTEEKFYRALGLAWIPPEIREDTGEIELAAKNELPHLLELSDIKGDFHIHSDFPIEPSHDLGQDSFEVMLKKAAELHYEYLGFSEHNPSLSKHTPEQTYQLLQKRKKALSQAQENTNNVRILYLLEADILPDGNLAIDEKSLSLLDATIVSIHSVFSMDKEQMTKRVLKGLSHPKAKILAHPTGRLINQRSGYDLDWKQIFQFCADNQKAIEINSWPVRLDLPDTLVRDAINMGVKLVIDTDSHAVSHMEIMRYGVAVARRGWATKDNIINSMSYNDLVDWLGK